MKIYRLRLVAFLLFITFPTSSWAQQALQQQPSEMVKSLLSKAEAGDPAAQMDVGTLYNQGKYVPQDFKMGMEWLKKSAAQNYLPAYAVLGGMYLGGEGVEPNKQTAETYFKKAMESGDPKIAYGIGVGYMTCKCGRDINKAREYFEFAADKGLARAQYDVGVMYNTGDGVPKNPEKSFQYFLAAAKSGYPSAFGAVAYAYAKGNGVAVDMEQARYWDGLAQQARYKAMTSLLSTQKQPVQAK